MEYRTVAQTAERWQVSQRLVRRLLGQNRVPGAVRLANEWLIPAQAQKPEDGRKQHRDISVPVFPPEGETDAYGTQVLAVSGALAGLRIGKARELASSPPEKTDGIWEAAWLLETGKLALYEGDSARWEAILRRLEEKEGENAQLVKTFLRALLGHPFQPPPMVERAHFESLHPDSVPFAWATHLITLFVSGQTERMIGAAEACCQLLTPCPTPQWLYLHLLAAAGYQRIGDTEASDRHFLAAVERAAGEGLWGPFVELQNLMVGMLPRLEKAAGEKQYRLKTEWVAYGAGWMRLRGYALRSTVTEVLTPRELDAALLAAAGDTNRVIGEKLGISESTVKKYLEVVYQKLDVRSRNGLKYVLPAREKTKTN